MEKEVEKVVETAVVENLSQTAEKEKKKLDEFEQQVAVQKSKKKKLWSLLSLLFQ